MTRFHEITASAPTLNAGPRTLDLVAMAIGLIMLVGIVLAGALAFGVLPDEPTAAPTRVEAIDGWLPGVTIANRERAISEANTLVDGWASALLKPEQPIVDGWASALLRPEPEIVDGWAERYLVDGD